MTDTKKCRKCKEEIPADAKVCSKCRAKQGNWFQRHLILTIILGLILLSAFGNALNGNKNQNSSPTNTNSTNNENKKTEEKIYSLGETFTLADKTEINITSMTEKASVGSQYFQSKPAEGGTYVAINWTVKNISDQPISSFSTPNIKLLSPTGVEYNYDINATSNYATEKDLDRKILSDLNPGILVNDAQVFEISSELFAQPGWQVVVSGFGKTIKVSLN